MIRGAFAAALTPLTNGGTRLDEEAFAPYAVWLADGGVDGILATGTTGEGILLSPAERRRVVELYVAAAVGRLPVAVHCGAQTTAETAALAAHAAEAGADAVAVIAPPYFPLDAAALEAHFAAAAAACAPLPFYVYEFAARSGYQVPVSVIERLRESTPNLRGLKVSDKPWEAVEPYLLDGLDIFVGAESLVARGLANGAAGAVSGLASVFPEVVAALVREPSEERSLEADRLRAALDRFPFQAAAKVVAARRGVAIRPDVRAPLRTLTAAELEGSRPAVILVAGAGAMGAGIAYRLAERGANVVLCDRGTIASGSTSRAMGGVRQQFSTAAEVRLAQESIAFFAELGPPFFHQVGYLFLATTEDGLAELEERRELQAGLGVPVERVDPAFVAGLETSDVLGAVFCAQDGVADPPAVAQELVRRAVENGVELREHTPAESALDEADSVVIACGPWSPALGRRAGVELPIRPLCRQLLATEALPSPPAMLPMVVETETGFHFRRRGDRLVLAMSDPEPRWTFETTVDESVFDDRLARLARRFPHAAGLTIADAWAGLYDMTPDAHPILGKVGDGVYSACGFSGHGFMQSPAVAVAIAEEILDGASTLDLSPYRLDRFADGVVFPEGVIL